VASVVRVIQNSAIAWLNIDAPDIQRGSSRSTTAPSVSRPITANVVITDSETAACARPTIGSMKAIWCTMNATCAISASANGPDTVQNDRLVSASRRVQAGSVDCACAGVAASAGTHSSTTGTRIASMTAAAISI